MQFAREGAKVLCVDRSGRSNETADLITEEGGGFTVRVGVSRHVACCRSGAV